MKKLFVLLLLLSACSPQNPRIVNGYIEGEYVYVSPYAGGILDEINVTRGEYVKPGDKLFAIDSKIWQANLQQARSELDKARANYDNLTKGKRQEELDVIIKQKAQAAAVFENAKKEYERAQLLIKDKIISKSDYDRKLADYKNAKEKIAELEASLETARLSAREDELKAARKDIEIAELNLLKIQNQAQNNAATAKVGGQIDDVYFRRGEYVVAGNPVVAILPPENVKIRFFVSEKLIPEIKLNMPVTVICDGCPQELTAAVTYISTKSEFTPPVIYSVESRDKLVFMVEAAFNDKTKNLRPGLPVSVRIE